MFRNSAWRHFAPARPTGCCGSCTILCGGRWLALITEARVPGLPLAWVTEKARRPPKNAAHGVFGGQTAVLRRQFFFTFGNRQEYSIADAHNPLLERPLVLRPGFRANSSVDVVWIIFSLGIALSGDPADVDGTIRSQLLLVHDDNWRRGEFQVILVELL